jgi:hypothetical protein
MAKHRAFVCISLAWLIVGSLLGSIWPVRPGEIARRLCGSAALYRLWHAMKGPPLAGAPLIAGTGAALLSSRGCLDDHPILT